jgi:putative phosphoesterase
MLPRKGRFSASLNLWEQCYTTVEQADKEGFAVKVGLFSDVHGHWEALEQALQLFTTHQVDQVLCAGDLVEKGPFSNRGTAHIQALSIPCVQGNHDASAKSRWFNFTDEMGDSALNYLANLLPSLEFTWEGVSLYLGHSNPWQDSSIYVYPTRHISLFQAILESTPAQLIILGHTHMPMRVEMANRLIVNPGTLYGNVDSDSVYGQRKRTLQQHTCAIVELPQQTVTLYAVMTQQAIPMPTYGL